MKKNPDLDRLRIASPCPVGWEQMTGDERVRLCRLCNLHVYNISEMTRSEAKSLIANSEGRICARLFRRLDGTVITRDCPVGLRAIRRRVAKTAGAVFATIMALCASVAGQQPAKKDKGCMSQTNITRKVSDSKVGASAISVKILDVNGAVVAGANVTITESMADRAAKKFANFWQLTSNDHGQVQLAGLATGLYDLKIESPGFNSFIVKKVHVGTHEVVNVDVILIVAAESVTVGILLGEPSPIDSPPGTTIISGERLRRLIF